MNKVLAAVFDKLPNYQIAIIGSAAKDYSSAADIDILFIDRDEFVKACAEYTTKPATWDAFTGTVSRANINMEGIEKPVQFIFSYATSSFDKHPHIVMTRPGVILHPNSVFKKVEGWRSKKSIDVSRAKEGKPVVAVDFDGTIRDWQTSEPLPYAKEVINTLREKGYLILIHSCNNPEWIEEWMNNHDIRYDSIWTEKGKPIASIYLDDRGLKFTSWQQALEDILNA